MKTELVLDYVPKYVSHIEINDDATAENRELRNWLGANCGCTWETEISKDCRFIKVYFDMDSAEEDLMGFKLQWL